jgi:ribosomal protein S18 acetylase RimI-like enzyme
MATLAEREEPISMAAVGIDRLEAVQPLWLALHRYHAEIGSAPLVTDEAAAWALRRAQYTQWLQAGEGFVLLAERRGLPVGYVVVHLQDGPDDTFPLGERWAEIYSLAVSPAARGQGIGSLLLDAVDARLAALGIRDVSVAAMTENTAALRLYERRGFVRREVVLYRFGGDEDSRS